MPTMPGTAPAPVRPVERRASCRHRPSCRLAELTWRESREIHSAAILLLNVSVGGAMALCDGGPLVGSAVRVRAEVEGVSRSAMGTVVGSREGDVRGRLEGPDLRTIRLAFRRD